jgi:hypothetical protein
LNALISLLWFTPTIYAGILIGYRIYYPNFIHLSCSIIKYVSPAPEDHFKVLNNLQWLLYYVKNMQNKRTIDKVRDITEMIQATYGYTSAQPIRDAHELLEEGRFNDKRIDTLFSIQPNVLDEYLVSMSKYQDTHNILNDWWH